MTEPQSRLTRAIIFTIPLVGILIALVGIELLYRLFRNSAQPVSWSDRPIGYFLPDQATSLQDGPSKPKEKDTFRIAVVGDSFTFGPNMQFDDTFAKRLERFLNLNAAAKRVEVLNRGFSGYSTAQEVDVVKQALVDSADLIVLEITLNDGEPHLLSREDKKALFEASYLDWKIFKVWSSLGFILSRVHNSQSHKAYINYHSKFFKEPASLAVFDDAIGKIQKIAASQNVPVIAMVFPMFDFPFDASYPFADVHQIIGQTLASHSIKTLDLRGAYTHIPPARLQVIPGVDSHPNEIANRIAAERLLAFLASNKLVPEESVPTRMYPQRRAMQTRKTSGAQVWKHSLKPLEELDFSRRVRRAKKKGL
jgi:lysophospholipase L1-like esterase